MKVVAPEAGAGPATTSGLGYTSGAAQPTIRCGVMQPTYLGWMGYYGLLDAVDVFVLLDSVPLSKQSWQTRNRVMGRDGRVTWLSIPVHASLGQRLDTVCIDNSRGWQKKHWRTLKAAYESAPGWGDIFDATYGAYETDREWQGLTEATGFIIQSLAYTLGIHTRIVRASTLGEVRDDKHGRLVDLCHAVGATTYMTTTGASYLDENQMEGIPVEWFEYQHPTYDQGIDGFTSHLSVLDCIAHCGTEALSTIRKGFYATGCDSAPKAHQNP